MSTIENELAKRDRLLAEKSARIAELKAQLGTDWLAKAKQFATSGITVEHAAVGILYALIAIAERLGHEN